MHHYRLYKSEKLCSKTAIDRLFSSGRSVMCYPLRVVWACSQRERGSASQFLISIPKRKHRHAVDRVLLRRRVREAYRLNKQLLLSSVSRERPVDLAFVWLSDEKAEFRQIEKKMQLALTRVAKQYVTETSSSQP